ncbi:MAG: DUF493 family protein [Bacteroidota bacterium]
MNGKEQEHAFKERLEGTHKFPGPYTFKFIVKHEQQKQVEELVENAEIRLKSSSGNKYVSVTIHAEMNTVDEVIGIYKRAKEIKGLIAL